MIQTLIHKLFTIAVAVVLIAPKTPLFAQDTQQNNFTLGIEGGIHFTNISNPGYPSPPKTLLKPVAGIFGIYDAGWPFLIKTGLYFDSRGYKSAFRSDYLQMSDTGYIGRNSYYEYDFKTNLNYLTIPVLAVFKRGNGKLKVLIEAGIYYSLLLTNRTKGYNNYFVSESDLPHFADSTLTAGNHFENISKPLDNFFNTYDFGLSIALGLTYELKPGLDALFNPGFTYGFANVFENPDYRSKWDNIFNLRVGFLYKLHPLNSKHIEK